jgi:hypothetical protein
MRNSCDNREVQSSQFCDLRDREIREMRDYAYMAENRDELREWLRTQIKARGHGTRVALAQFLNLKPDAITRMLNVDPEKESREIKAAELDRMREFFNADESAPKNVRMVTVAAYVQAGYWAEQWEWTDDEQYQVGVPDDPTLRSVRLYAAETKGPSMNRRWPEGTSVVFTNVMETEESPMPGKRYVVERTRSDGQREHTVKLLHRDDAGKFWLVPESTDPLFQSPISVELGSEEGDEVRIVGRVRFAVVRE